MRRFPASLLGAALLTVPMLMVTALPVAAAWTMGEQQIDGEYVYIASQTDTTGAFRFSTQCHYDSYQLSFFLDSQRKGSPSGREIPAIFTIGGTAYDLKFAEADGNGREKLAAQTLNQEMDFAEVWVALLESTDAFELDVAGVYLDFDATGMAEALATVDEACMGEDF